MKLKFLSLFFIVLLSGCLVNNISTPNSEKVSSFEECVKEGNAVMESYPRQCRSRAGDLFVEEVEVPDNNMNDDVVCIEIYDPVCGQIEVQCITAPCDPVWQTFSNDCFASAAKAKNIKKGTCEDLGF